MNSKDKVLIILICIFAALASWFYVVTERNPETTENITDINIDIRNQTALNDSGLVVSNIDVSTVDVRIRGLRNEIINIDSTDINAFIDVVGYSEGSNKVSVEIKVPENVELIDYNPKQILCEFEAVINKSVDLEIDINGNEASGYYAMRSESSVNTVVVKGPRSVLNSIERAVVYMDISGAAQTLTKRIPINVYNDKGIELNLELNPAIAEITIPIYPIKEVEVDIPITGEVKEGYEIKEIRIEPGTVLIAGKQDRLSNIKTVRCEPISVEEADANIYLPAEFIQGNYYIIENVNPRIEIEIEKIISKDLIYNIEDIEYKNIPEGLEVGEVEVNSDFILVTIEGISSIINQVSKEDIVLTADLKEGVQGSNLVEFQIDTNIGLNSFEIFPVEGNVILTINTETEETNENLEQIEDEVVQ